MQTERNMGGEMTDEQMKELAELRVAIQDLKYQLIQKHDLRELSDEEIQDLWAEMDWSGHPELEFARAILKKAGEK